MSLSTSPARSFTLGIAFVGLAVVATGCRVSFDRDFGPTMTESFDIEPFTELEVDGAWDVTIAIGPETTLEIEAGEDLFDDIDVDVDGDRLKIKVDDIGWFTSSGTQKARITTPNLTALFLDGAADVDIDGLESSSLEADLNGAVDLDLGDMDIERVELDLDGATSVDGDGNIGRLIVSSNGASSLDFDDVTIGEAEVVAGGASSIDLSGAQSISGELSGASSLEVSDDATVDVRTSGASSVND